MRIGFIGTGTISAAMIRGLRATDTQTPVILSPRSAETAQALATEAEATQIAPSNQAVIDHSDIVVLAVRPQILSDVLSTLTFRSDQIILSLVATVSVPQLRTQIGDGPELVRAVPLPFVEQRIGGTPVYPAHPEVLALFDKMGSAIAVHEEPHLDRILAASSIMGSYFETYASVMAWLAQDGISPDQARTYIEQVLAGLSASAQTHADTSYADLAVEFSTPGGLNEQMRTSLREGDVFERYTDGMDGLLKRIKG